MGRQEDGDKKLACKANPSKRRDTNCFKAQVRVDCTVFLQTFREALKFPGNTGVYVARKVNLRNELTFWLRNMKGQDIRWK